MHAGEGAETHTHGEQQPSLQVICSQDLVTIQGPQLQAPSLEMLDLNMRTLSPQNYDKILHGKSTP